MFQSCLIYYVWKIINDILSKIRKDYLKPNCVTTYIQIPVDPTL